MQPPHLVKRTERVAVHSSFPILCGAVKNRLCSFWKSDGSLRFSSGLRARWTMFELSILVVVFILLSGLAAMVDAAVLGVSGAETEEMVVKKAWGSLQLKKLTRHLTRALVVMVIVTNTINVIGPILVGQSAVST